MTKIEAKAALKARGFKFSHRVGNREYWVRTDGEKDIFLDHSATITSFRTRHLISDFIQITEAMKETV